MRPLLTAVLLCALTGGPAASATIGLYDQFQGLCAGQPLPVSVYSVYVFHEFPAPGSAGSRWRVTNTSGYPLVGSAGPPGYVHIGIPTDGITVQYPTCIFESTMIWRLDYLALTTVTGCYHLEVVADPNEASIVVYDCDFEPTEAWGGKYSFSLTNGCYDCAGPVEPSTWGKVKSMYR